MKTTLLRVGMAVLAAGQLHAQSFTTDVTITSSGTAVPNLKVQGNGGVLFKGTGSTTGTIPATGAGTRLMWYPAKSAFLAGTVSGAQWDNIGTSSAVFGANNQAPGDAGFAAGSNNGLGTGWCSAALGINNVISGSSASTAIGQSNLVNGGYNSFAAGAWNSLAGEGSIAVGESNTSSGWAAATIGRALTSAAAGCVVVGMANTPIVGNANYWVGADPVFIVGNGTSNSAASGESGPVTSNAFVIYKNGDIKIPKPQGDISMGEFAP